MSELGNLLRETREEKGLTLADVEFDTHIRRAYVEALEEGDRKRLPDLVYVRGLVSTYSHYLELPTENVKGLLEREYGSNSWLSAEANSHQPLNVPLNLGSRSSYPVLIIVAVIAVITFLIWFYWPVLEPWGRDHLGLSSTGSTSPATIATAPESTPEETSFLSLADRPTPTSSALPLPTPAPSATPTSLPARVAVAPTPTPFSGVSVVVQVTSPAWLRIIADGEVIHEGTLESGAEREWQAGGSLVLRTGNAGGTVVFVNGQALGPLGEAGVVVEREWRWVDGRIQEVVPEE